MLRIAVIGPAYPYRGGISHYNTCLIRALSARHEVTAINYRRLYPDFLFPGKTQYDESAKALSVDSERIIDSVNPASWIRAAARIARLRPDLVVAEWWHPFFAPALFTVCAAVRLLRRGRIVFICHNVMPHERSIVDRMLARVAFSQPHGFIVQSAEDERNLVSIRPRAPVRVRPHPIYDFFKTGSIDRAAARRRVGAKEGKSLLLFFGYVRQYKGLRYLLEAMPAIRERIAAELLVVGEFYEDRAPYDEIVSRLGLGDAVRFVDRYVGNEEVEPFFVASDLVVMPYVSATQSGIAQIAVAFDRPVVVTAVGGLPEVVSAGKTGFVVPPRDPPALAAAVVSFFEEGWASRMAPHFESEKRRFSWEAMVEAIEEIAVVSRGGGE